MAKAILFDSSHCTACRGCQVACKCWNGLPSPTEKNATRLKGSYQSPQDLNGDTRLLITFHEEAGGEKGVNWAFGRRACQHCTDAPCAQICPANAIHVDADTGLVTVDDSKCIGCQYCSTACPFDVPHYHTVGGKTVINKCTGCVDRIEHGLEPACVTTCQPGALQFGERDKMLEIAHERVEFLKGKGYENACVYGEDQMGGLHVIQVLKHGVEAHGQVKNPHVNPVTTLTGFMKPFTGVISGVAVVAFAAMVGLAAGYRHKKLAYNPATEDTLNVETGDIVEHGDPEDKLTVAQHMNEAMGKGGHHE